jgi:hypothetical protein
MASNDSSWPPRRQKHPHLVTIGVPLSGLLAAGGVGLGAYTQQDAATKQDVQRQVQYVEIKCAEELRSHADRTHESTDRRLRQIETRVTRVETLIEELLKERDRRRRR